MPDQITMFDDNPEYAAFVEKFKPKKITDDCYTEGGTTCTNGVHSAAATNMTQNTVLIHGTDK